MGETEDGEVDWNNWFEKWVKQPTELKIPRTVESDCSDREFVGRDYELILKVALKEMEKWNMTT
jgi:hypothetical protein